MATPTKRAARSIPRQRDEDEEATQVTAAAPVEDDDDEDEEKPTATIRRGFSAARQTADSTSPFAQAFKLDDKIQVIKFLEDEPYAAYTRHWVERMTPTGRANRSYNCNKNWGKACPLCEVGDKPQAVSAFNIALIGDDGHPTLKTWDCGPKLLGIIESYARDPKVAPINKGFFLASRSGKMGSVNYQIVPVKAHSLAEDYDIDPPSEDDLTKLGVYDSSIITMPKTKDLEEIAAEIADDY
jgi:hypothetical protein